MKNLKNYTSNTPNTIQRIQKCLTEHSAKKIIFDYDDNGKIKELTFILNIGHIEYGFRLPARVEKVAQIFYNEKNKNIKYLEWKKDLTEDQKEQAYRTAWANIRDWIEAQMALVDTEQVKIEEVFFPYMVNGKDEKTLFEILSNREFRLEKLPERIEIV